MTKLGSLCAVASLIFAACDDTNHVTSIDYNVSEYPMSGKRPWSCLADGRVDGSGAGIIAWTVGAPLEVFAVVTFERACGGIFGSPCPDPQLVFSAQDESTWIVADGPAPGAFFGPNARYLQAVGVGWGGLKVSAQGRPFAPLALNAVAPAAFQFLRVDGVPSAITVTPITRLSLAAGASALVVPQLVAGSGTRLCGFAEQVVTADGVTVNPDITENMDGRANAPEQVTVATTSGTVHFAAAGATGDLPIDVTP